MDARKRGALRIHVWTVAPIIFRDDQPQANLVFKRMRRRVDLNMHSPPQCDPHRCDCDKIARCDLPLVFRFFRGSQVAFIALSSQFVDPSLRRAVGLQLYQFFGSFGVQASTYRFQEAFEEGGGSIAAFHDPDYTSGSIPLEEGTLDPSSESA